MFFSFLTAKIKCGNEALNIANRQNAYNVVVATNIIIELYRIISRQNELNRKTFIFSISHDYRAVRIYNYYILINKKNISFYYYLLRDFSIIDQDDKDK